MKINNGILIKTPVVLMWYLDFMRYYFEAGTFFLFAGHFAL